MRGETVTRFAPSPTGFLHLGHAYAALFAAAAAEAEGGTMLLRIEDIDRTRCRPEYEAAILEDLGWLGLAWPEPVRRQSEHFGDYAAAIGRLERPGLLYPCFCTRSDIRREIARSPSAPHGPEGPVYPGTCRALSARERETRRRSGAPFALRLDVAAARAHLGNATLTFRDATRGIVEARPERFGDVVVARKDAPASYHIAVTVDDHLQGVTLVTRGEDLFEATHIHRLLQALLDLAPPLYDHHPLVRDKAGRRFAKRERSATLRDLRAGGASPSDVRRMVGLDAA